MILNCYFTGNKVLKDLYMFPLILSHLALAKI